MLIATLRSPTALQRLRLLSTLLASRQAHRGLRFDGLLLLEGFGTHTHTQRQRLVSILVLMPI